MPIELPELPRSRDNSLPRYSQRRLPSYRFVPGLHPHPVRDPLGHSYQQAANPHRQEPWRADEWRTLLDWRYGVDLFNRFYFWEAHEAWEGLWTVAERDGAPRLLLQGLIQIAAACLKAHMGVGTGARSLSTEGLAKLHRAGSMQTHLMGLHIPELCAQLDFYFERLMSEQPIRLALDLPILQLAI